MFKYYVILFLYIFSFLYSEEVGALNIGINKCIKLIQSDNINGSMNEIRKAINCGYFDRIRTSSDLITKLNDLEKSEKNEQRRSAYLVVCAVGNIGLNSKDGYSHALELLDLAASINDKLPEIFNTRGILKVNAKDVKSGISDYTRAIELNPNYLDALDNRCRAYMLINRSDLALTDQEKVQDLKNSVYYSPK